MPTKDGNLGPSPRGARRSRSIAPAIATLAVGSIGAFFIARRALSAFAAKRKARGRLTASAEGTPIQQFARYRADDGTQSIHGTLIAEFAPGERSATLYTAFCPPFERLPIVEAEAADGAPASVKLTQVLHNGVQIDVRLSEPSGENESVTIELMATDATQSEI